MNEPIKFDSRGSKDPDSRMLEYLWIFGDNTVGQTTAFPEHTFAQAGEYDVSLVVYDNFQVPFIRSPSTLYSWGLPPWVPLAGVENGLDQGGDRGRMSPLLPCGPRCTDLQPLSHVITEHSTYTTPTPSTLHLNIIHHNIVYLI